MLRGPNNRAVHHRVFVVGVAGQTREHPLPNASLGPPAEAGMDNPEVAKPLRQIAPGNPSSIALENRVDKQTTLYTGFGVVGSRAVRRAPSRALARHLALWTNSKSAR